MLIYPLRPLCRGTTEILAIKYIHRYNIFIAEKKKNFHFQGDCLWCGNQQALSSNLAVWKWIKSSLAIFTKCVRYLFNQFCCTLAQRHNTFEHVSFRCYHVDRTRNFTTTASAWRNIQMGSTIWQNVPFDLSGQVWYLIVLIPDLCRLSYFEVMKLHSPVTKMHLKMSFVACMWMLTSRTISANGQTVWTQIRLLYRSRYSSLIWIHTVCYTETFYWLSRCHTTDDI